MIHLQGISKSFDDKPVIDGLSLDLPETGIVTFCGESGCGKSTLLKLIMGIERPDKGCVENDGVSFSAVFENDILLPWEDVLGNVKLVLHNDALREERAYDALAKVALESEAHAAIDELSGGMRRRVAIARAIAFGGEVLVLDEPTIRLDRKLSFMIMDTLCAMWRERLIILVTHDAEIARRYSNTIYTITGTPISEHSLSRPQAHI